MKKIGLTQRVEVVAAYHERRDCLDQSWISLLLNLGLLPVPLPNITDKHEITPYLKSLDLDGVILTGGNDLASTGSDGAAYERDQFESTVIDWCIENSKPILGVCRGMQMLNVYFGGGLVSVDKHVTSSHRITLEDGNSYDVNSYHGWGISGDQLAKTLLSLGQSDDELIEFCRHKTLPITAMMWHPERSNKDSSLGEGIIKEVFL